MVSAKTGQLMQPDINDVTPEQVREFNLGSILNGGDSAPDKNLRNTPDSWLALADEFWEASTDTSDGGGTHDGIDQGDNRSSETELRDIHAAGYPGAIAAGAQTVMASYNSFHGHKLHGMKTMLTDVLVGRMGFDGYVVGDWNGHGQVRGCKNDSCADSFNAGLMVKPVMISPAGFLFPGRLQQNR
jgi:hypothetical protein